MTNDDKNGGENYDDQSRSENDDDKDEECKVVKRRCKTHNIPEKRMDKDYEKRII